MSFSLLPDRLPPQSIDAEMACLGSALINAGAADTLLELLKRRDFYLESHRKVFDVLAYLTEEDLPVDLLSVQEELRRRGQLEQVGGQAYLAQLSETVPTAIHAEYYARQVERKSTLRQLIDAAGEITAAAYDEEQEVPEIVAAAQEAILEVGAATAGIVVVPARAGIMAAVARSMPGRERDPNEALRTGIPSLDRLLGGLKRSKLYVVAGRPSMGKTWFALEIARVTALAGYRVGLYSLEMDEPQVSDRLLAREAEVNLSDLTENRLPFELWKARVPAASDRLRDIPLSIMDESDLSAAEIRAHARRLQRKPGCDLVIIDHLSEIRHPEREASEHLRYTKTVKTLRLIAQQKGGGPPVLLLAQLSRNVERREDKRPVLSDLRESGSIEELADVVLLLYRERYYERMKEGGHDDGGGPVEIRIPKHRGGATGVVTVQGDMACGRFWEPSRYGDADAPPEGWF